MWLKRYRSASDLQGEAITTRFKSASPASMLCLCRRQDLLTPQAFEVNQQLWTNVARTLAHNSGWLASTQPSHYSSHNG